MTDYQSPIAKLAALTPRPSPWVVAWVILRWPLGAVVLGTALGLMFVGLWAVAHWKTF